MENIKKRVFIALNLPEKIRKNISGLINKLDKNDGSVKWVRGEGLHITLHFLSYLDDKQIEEVKRIMAKFAGQTGVLQLKLNGLSAFPNIERPRVIFLESEQTNGASIFVLQNKLGSELEKIGIQTDKRPWTPHITLGRVKRNYELGIINYEFEESTFSISSFELMGSELSSDGAKYKIINSFEL